MLRSMIHGIQDLREGGGIYFVVNNVLVLLKICIMYQLRKLDLAVAYCMPTERNARAQNGDWSATFQ